MRPERRQRKLEIVQAYAYVRDPTRSILRAIATIALVLAASPEVAASAEARQILNQLYPKQKGIALGEQAAAAVVATPPMTALTRLTPIGPPPARASM